MNSTVLKLKEQRVKQLGGNEVNFVIVSSLSSSEYQETKL
jgi:hypothetical protein